MKKELQDLDFYTQYNIRKDAYDLSMFDKRGKKIATSIKFEAIEPGNYAEPLVFSKDSLQSLFNQLWQQGFRPNDGTGNAGHLDAIKYHLEDMRKLVFKEKK